MLSRSEASRDPTDEALRFAQGGNRVDSLLASPDVQPFTLYLLHPPHGYWGHGR